MPKCVFLFKSSAGENINWGIVFTIQYENIRLHWSRIICNYCLEFKSEQSDALSFAKLPIHSKMLFYFCLFSQLLSCFIGHSFHSLESIPRCTRTIKRDFSTIWGQCRQRLSPVVTCISDEWDESSSSIMCWQLLSGGTGYWWPLLLDKTWRKPETVNMFGEEGQRKGSSVVLGLGLLGLHLHVFFCLFHSYNACRTLPFSLLLLLE